MTSHDTQSYPQHGRTISKTSCFPIFDHMISYHMISYHMIWYHISRGRDATETGNFFQELYSDKMTFKNDKSTKQIRETILYTFIVESLQDFFSRTSFDYFRFSRTIAFCERARNSCEHTPFRCGVVNLERSHTVRTHTKWPVIFVAAPGLCSTGP